MLPRNVEEGNEEECYRPAPPQGFLGGAPPDDESQTIREDLFPEGRGKGHRVPIDDDSCGNVEAGVPSPAPVLWHMAVGARR